MHEKLQTFHLTLNKFHISWPPGWIVHPGYLPLTSPLLDKQTLHFPLSLFFHYTSFIPSNRPTVIKHTHSCGSAPSHKHTIVFNIDQLNDSLSTLFKQAEPTDPDSPAVSALVQQAVPHTPFVWKVYVIYGDAIFTKFDGSINLERLHSVGDCLFNLFSSPSDFFSAYTYNTQKPIACEQPPELSLPSSVVQSVAEALHNIFVCSLPLPSSLKSFLGCLSFWF